MGNTQYIQLRDTVIDLLKGFLILTVVLGHAVQWKTYNDFSHPIFRFIYSFHMPLFMWVSGYLCFDLKTQTPKINLEKRFFSLIIPFFSWFLLNFIIWFLFKILIQGQSFNHIFFLKDKFIHLLKQPDSGLWFLWVLFWLCFFLKMSFQFKKFKEEINMIIIMILLILYVILFPNYRYLGVSLISWYIFFFTFGYCFNKYKDFLNTLLNNKIITGGVILAFLYLVQFWKFGMSFDFLETFNFSIILKKIIYLSYKYTVPILGIISFYIIFSWIKNKNINFINKNLLKLSPITLEIYTTHYLFLNAFYLIDRKYFSVDYLSISIGFLFSLFGSIYLSNFLKRNKFVAKLLYGQ